MKKIAILFTVIQLQSCGSNTNNTNQKPESPAVQLSVIRDRTDRHVLQPDPGSVLSIFNLSENKNTCVGFRYHEITDKMLEPIVNLELGSEAQTEKQNVNNEPLFRQKLIVAFYDTITTTLTAVNTNSDSSDLDYSECFRTIADELTVLSGSNAQKRILLAYSNLFENSEILSVYKKSTGKLLVPAPENIKDLFEKSKLLPGNLKGIKVVFLFKPITREEDQEYMKMIGVYKLLLEPRGAEVFVRANNTFSDL